MSRITSILLFIGTFASSAYAQSSYEYGAMIGGSNYHGDLAYNIVPKETNLSAGAYFRYNLNEYWSMRPTVSYLKISGADINFDEYKLRNLSFSNRIYEFSNVMEFNFQPFSNKFIHHGNTFYVMAGVAGFIHKPMAELDGEMYELQTAQTENAKYKLMQISIPFGVGFKQSISKNLLIGFEAGWRKTFTDHLDDVSTVYPNLDAGNGSFHRLADRSWEVTEDGLPRASEGDMRGDPNLDDWYFQTAFTISYRFTPIRCAFDVNFFK